MAMSSPHKFLAAGSLCAGILLGLNGCGGGDSSPTSIETFKSAYASSLAALNSPAVLAGASVQDLFDTKFLDSGFTRADIVAALNSEGSAIQNASDYSSIPQVTLVNATVSDCVSGPEYLCTLTGTLTNGDADTTSIPFTTKLRFADGKLRLYGDQLASEN